MKGIKNTGLVIFLIGLGIFTALPLLGTYKLDKDTFDQIAVDNGFAKSILFVKDLENNVVEKEFNGMQSFSPIVAKGLEDANAQHRKNKEYNKIIYTKPHDMAALLGKASGTGFIVENKGLMWFFTFGLGIIGALMFILPNVILLGKKALRTMVSIMKMQQTEDGSHGWSLSFWSDFI